MNKDCGYQEHVLRGHFLERVPDSPRYVLLRAMLLDQTSRLVGNREGAIILSSRCPLAFLWGSPSAETLGPFAQEGLEILSEQPFEGLLPGWVWERGTFMTLAGEERLLKLMGEAEGCVEPLTSDLLEWVPVHLRKDLSTALELGTAMCALVNDLPVSFASAYLRSESYFDLSVDTLEAHRNGGLARRCAAAVIQAERNLGRNPIWGALDSNIASLRTGQSLGFVPQGNLWVATKDYR